MRSKSKNTPFDGWTLRGGVAATIVGGRVVYINEQLATFNAQLSTAFNGHA
jgi:dihydroorotase-like cyclic amidohydrolase